ncbi:ATP-binding cassette sub-family B member 11 [Capsaspora owczarzaki ATCC 30864]|uniref:ATP-binding cassette sub-family B member 11 n=1 Tax=Capsaspora owczarzaki (strain ATCC 30864) TaxID=595528 RepID=A0A0D2UA05_CAPO3|nr:ATP-binding cassette sub-family B member 11 [Capsaspora owczarzaki ATCC 30864]KJE91891.1 ATP-binding cassette sub-family B member 11 [Capsaspora owczarzaki ATCC 30864]|eukprot:XP_004363794.2 ATP-binding cassette sub-family B member 11 [Capsaspora owczarzaki ATCC 30864]
MSDDDSEALLGEKDRLLPQASAGRSAAGAADAQKPLPAVSAPKAKPPRVAFKRLFRFATKVDVLLMVLGTLGAVASGASSPFFSLLFGDVIDIFTQFVMQSPAAMTGDELKSKVLTYLWYFLGIAGGVAVVCFLQMALWSLTAERQGRRLRIRYLTAILGQDIAWFDKQQSGSIASRISSDVELIQDGIGDKVGVAVQCVTSFLVSFGIGFYKGYKLALVLLSVMPLLIIAAAVIGKVVMSITIRGQQAYAEAGAVAEETFSSIRTVAALGGESREIARYHTRLQAALKSGLRQGSMRGLSIAVTMFIMFGSYALGFWYGSTLILDGDMTPGELTTVFFSLIMGAMGLGRAAPAFSSFAEAMGAAYTVHEIIDRQSLVNPFSDEGRRPANISGEIEFKQVNFAYPSRPEDPVLQNFNLQIRSSETVALVGSSGCGKSTCMSLLQRFYDATQGSVIVDGVDVREWNTGVLRSSFGVVSQEPVLFNDTIFNNIAHGKLLAATPQDLTSDSERDAEHLLTATMEEVIAVAKQANAHDFISALPSGYHTIVGDRGIQLSGGQKQRVAIARALIRNPKILLLDEATSALDVESERIVQDALDRASKGRTTLIVAHRLSTIRNADRIVVMQKGQIVEIGTHDSLIAIPDGFYANLVQKQLVSAADASNTLTPSTSTPEASQQPSRQATPSPLTSAPATHTTLKVSDAASAPSDVAKPVSIARVYRYTRPELWYIILGLIFSAVNGCTMPAFSYVFSSILEVFTESGEELKKDAVFYSLMFLAIAGGTFIAQFLQHTCWCISGEQLTTRLRLLAFNNVIRQDIAFFDQEHHATGSLTTMLATDATLVKGLSGSVAALVIQALVSVVAGLVIAFWSGWKLTLVVLASLPLLTFANVFHMKAMTGYHAMGKKDYQKAGAIATESVSCIRTVASLHAERRFLRLFKAQLRVPFALGVRRSMVAGVGFGVSQSIVFVVYGVALYYSAVLVSDPDEHTSYGDAMRIMTAVMFSLGSAAQTFSFVPDISKAKAAAAKIFELIDTKSEIDSSSPHGIALQHVQGEISFDQVDFVYPSRPDAKILSNLSFVGAPQQTVAIVGSSGGGKSTVISLLERFYNPASGTIALDGQPIDTLHLRSYRSTLALVSQEPTLFNCSIQDNLLYGLDADPLPSMDAIMVATKQANIHDFIMGLPEQYNTNVGEKGTQLSGGQKQRIAIARALLRNPRVLLLDEATSALDAESEKLVQVALELASNGRTTVVIAHRLSTIRNANVILAVKGGRVAEQGSHDQLMAIPDGVYRSLVLKQMEQITH